VVPGVDHWQARSESHRFRPLSKLTPEWIRHSARSGLAMTTDRVSPVDDLPYVRTAAPFEPELLGVESSPQPRDRPQPLRATKRSGRFVRLRDEVGHAVISQDRVPFRKLQTSRSARCAARAGASDVERTPSGASFASSDRMLNIGVVTLTDDVVVKSWQE